MDTFARNALRLSLAGAGVAVLGAGFVGQASAAETLPADTGAPDVSTLTDATPDAGQDNHVSIAGQDVGELAPSAPSAATLPTATTPSSDSLPSLTDTQGFQIPSVANLEAPGLS